MKTNEDIDMIKIHSLLRSGTLSEEKEAILIRDFLDRYDMDYKEFCVQLWELDDKTK